MIQPRARRRGAGLTRAVVVGALVAATLGLVAGGTDPAPAGSDRLAGPVTLISHDAPTSRWVGASDGPAWAPSPAGDTNLCAAGSPCVTRLSVKADGPRNDPGSVSIVWNGSSERYNIEFSAPGKTKIKKYDLRHNPVHPNLTSIKLPAGAWGRTWTLGIQGCDSGTFSSDCTGWVSRQVTLQAPRAPKNVRLVGDAVHWDTLDSATTYAFLRGTPAEEGDGEFSGTLQKRRQVKLPFNWRDYTRIELCAENPGGRACTDVPLKDTSTSEPEPPPQPLPAKPATPGNPQGGYQNGFGTPIQLTWADTADETYYYLTASSVDGDVGQRLPAPAPRLGKDSTSFTAAGDVAALVGGVRFSLQACNPGGCSAPATVTVR